MSDTAPQPGPALHGPGGLLATPGLAAPKRRTRKWGLRLKAKQIVGNLYRSDTGKFQAGGGGSAAGKPVRGRQLSKQPTPTAKPIKAAPAPKRRGGGKGKPAAKPKPTPEQRQQARDTASAAKQTQNRSAVSDALANADASLGPSGVSAVLSAADGGPIDSAMGAQLQQLGYAQQNPDGSYRLTSEARALASAANRGDTRAALDADGRAQERAKKATDSAAKKPAAAPTKPAKAATGPQGALDAIGGKLTPPTKPAKPAAAGGGGSKKPAEQPDKAAERAKKASDTASQVGMAAPDLAALRSATETGGVQNAALSQLGLVGADGLATDQGRRALTALERGDVRQYNAALQDAKARMGREQAARDRTQATADRRTATQQQQLARIKRRAQAGGKLTQSQMDQATEAGILDANGRWKSKSERSHRFIHQGELRAAYERRMAELTQAGFDQRMAQNIMAAPHQMPVAELREVYQRLLQDGDADDAGEGLLRVLYAPLMTGTVKNATFAVFKDHQGQPRWIARTTTAYRDRDGEIISEAALDADSQRMTTTKQFGPLRYWHVGQPDPFDTAAPWGPGLDIGRCDYSVVIGRTRIESGTFDDTAIAQAIAQKSGQYEMSPGFFHPLDQPDPAKVFHAIQTFERSIVPMHRTRASNLFTGFTVKEFRMELDEMERRFKAAIADLGLDASQAAAFGQQLVATEKAAAAQGIAFKETEAALPDMVINGITYKAFPPKADDAAEVAPEIEAKADDPMDAIAEEVIEPEAEMAGDYLGDMSWDEFSTKLSALLAPVLKMQDMVKSIGDAHAELKGMYGGAATKDAGVTAELVALKAQQTELAAKIAQIEGDQPAVILPDDVALALKSTGPTNAQEPGAPDVPNDPSRPFAQIAARTMPQLYSTAPDGGFAGWGAPPAAP